MSMAIRVVVASLACFGLACQIGPSDTRDSDAQTNQDGAMRLISLPQIRGQRLGVTERLMYSAFDPSAGKFQEIGMLSESPMGFLSLYSVAVEGGTVHFAGADADEFYLIFVPSGVALQTLDGGVYDDWELPLLHIARSRCPMFVPDRHQRLVPLTDAQGQTIGLQQGDGVYLSMPTSTIPPGNHAGFVWTVLANPNGPKVVWTSRACLEPVVDPRQALESLGKRAEQIRRDAASDIGRISSASITSNKTMPSFWYLEDRLISFVHARMTSQQIPSLSTLRAEIEQLLWIYARQLAYPMENGLSTAPITYEELRMVVAAESELETDFIRIPGYFVNEIQVMSRSRTDPFAWDVEEARGFDGPTFDSQEAYPSTWTDARARLVANLSQDLTGIWISPQFPKLASRFSGDYAFDWRSCVSMINCSAPKPDSLFLTPAAAQTEVPWDDMQLLSSLMADLVSVFNIEFMLAGDQRVVSNYIINTGIAHSVHLVPPMQEIGHIHPMTQRALTASFILPVKLESDVVYFDNKNQRYAPDEVGEASDICAMLTNDEQDSFIFLRSGTAIRHQLPINVESRFMELPVRTRHGRVTVAIDRMNPCWKSDLGGFAPERDNQEASFP